MIIGRNLTIDFFVDGLDAESCGSSVQASDGRWGSTESLFPYTQVEVTGPAPRVHSGGDGGGGDGGRQLENLPRNLHLSDIL